MVKDRTENYQKYYLHCIKEGLCTQCHKPLDRKGRLCIACSEESKRYQKEIREERKSQGLCQYCGNPNTRHPLPRCQNCLNREKIYRDKARNKK